MLRRQMMPFVAAAGVSTLLLTASVYAQGSAQGTKQGSTSGSTQDSTPGSAGSQGLPGSTQKPSEGRGMPGGATTTTTTTTTTQTQLTPEQERESMRLRDYIQQQSKMTGTEVEAMMPLIRDYVRYRAQHARMMQPAVSPQPQQPQQPQPQQPQPQQQPDSQTGMAGTQAQSLQQDELVMMVREARSLQCTSTCLHESVRLMNRAMERGASTKEAMQLTSNVLREQAKERGQARGTWNEMELAQVRTEFDERLDNWEKMNMKRLEQERRRQQEARGPNAGGTAEEISPNNR